MIGVIAREKEMDAVREFFELFKTPWEPWNSGKAYDVVLCAAQEIPSEFRAKLVIAYSGSRLASDPADAVENQATEAAKLLCYKDDEIPLYGKCVTFPPQDGSLLNEPGSRRSAVWQQPRDGRQAILRVGYDLFEEVRHLLTHGQPAERAGIPALELHIDFLREQIRAAGVAFVEIPPVPQGYRFIVCLTHDVDHPAVRKHRWDHTAAGFLYRGSIGSLVKFVRRQISAQSLIRNWMAVAKWPLVQRGLAQDFWADFHQQYRKIEGGLPSTYFVIPFSGKSGRGAIGLKSKRRAAGYGAQDIAPAIREIVAGGSEVGLHGIDAWLDSSAAVQELEEIRNLTGKREIGVRMHWLCYDEQSPKQLERAGASYDSTIGYRETVGYRAGTTQAYMPPGAESLLELPLHVMDTALFYPGYLGLTGEEAAEILARLVDHAVRFGGCLTVNWHDRSLAPERLWIEPYAYLIEQLKNEGAWFATAGEAVAWFRKRRSAVFEEAESSGAVRIRMADGQLAALPPLQLRALRSGPGNALDGDSIPDSIDQPLSQAEEVASLAPARA